jgi:polar amino acid transport system substrate-binding protein
MAGEPYTLPVRPPHPTRRPVKKLPLLAALLLLPVAAACGAKASGTSSQASAGANPCPKGKLATLHPPKLTIGTDNPVYDPYFLGPTGHAWTGKFNHDPYNGTGFEGAVAYAVANQLGYPKQRVAWSATHFNESFKPGPKNFDFYLAQVSYTPTRAKSADLSSSYYNVSQALVALDGKPIDKATSIADLKGYKLGAQVATTGYDLITNRIHPSQDPSVFTTTNDALSALKAGQVDGIIVDYPTAYYMANIQLPNGNLVGQFPAPAGGEHFSLVLQKDSPLTRCVNDALAALRSNGTLATIQQRWLSGAAHAPVLK